MNDTFGDSRKRLMRHLLRNKGGASIDELAVAMCVTRTAVRQHLASLIPDGFVAAGDTRATGGRPRQLYVLTARGREEFPRRYSWFAQLLVEAIEQEHGVAGLRLRLGRIARAVVSQLPPAKLLPGGHRGKVKSLSELMDDLGYDARLASDVVGAPVIDADNCVFHELASKNPDVCHFDMTLLSAYSGAQVTMSQCMAKGGHVCRFHFRKRT